MRTVLLQRTIPPGVARDAVDFLLRSGVDVWVYCGTEWFLRDANAFRVDRETRTVGFSPTVVPDFMRCWTPRSRSSPSARIHR